MKALHFSVCLPNVSTFAGCGPDNQVVVMIKNFARSFSIVGLFFAVLFFCASLTPSMLPRPPMIQGILSGILLVVGYGVGKAALFSWRFLEIKELDQRYVAFVAWPVAALLALLSIYTLSRTTVWQNSIRELMEVDQISSGYPVRIAVIALVTAIVLILVVRALIRLGEKFIRQLNRVLPRRISVALGSVIAVILVTTIVNGVFVQTGLRALDKVFLTIDRAQDEGVAQPLLATTSGSPQSLVSWDDIGINGKRFLIDGPDQAEIAEFTGRPAQQPIRIVAGYGSGDTFEDRARIAVADLKRAGGFERSTLVVATLTGTGWLDPAFSQPLAFMHQGDVAIVTMQYSYVPSWLSIIVDPDRSRRAAKALYDEVFDYWTTLPRDTRPELYLFGLSLGALGSEASGDMISLLSDPINGALWSGPPFASTSWAQITKGRKPESPYWRPKVRDGSLVRFMNQDGFGPSELENWGPLRVVYLQHASDPMVFFSPDLALNRPDWLGEGDARGPDVSPFFKWFPFVTFLQVGFDIPMAASVPAGYGHTYAPAHYIDAWLEVAQPKGWSAQDTERLKQRFTFFEASPI